jgi:hypothetical protein
MANALLKGLSQTIDARPVAVSKSSGTVPFVFGPDRLTPSRKSARNAPQAAGKEDQGEGKLSWVRDPRVTAGHRHLDLKRRTSREW